MPENSRAFTAIVPGGSAIGLKSNRSDRGSSETIAVPNPKFGVSSAIVAVPSAIVAASD
jgi:hypothetical protein